MATEDPLTAVKSSSEGEHPLVDADCAATGAARGDDEDAADGAAHGNDDGAADGASRGDADGAAGGAALGDAEGAADSASIGEAEGAEDGAELGNAERAADRAALGNADGAAEGAALGDVDGAAEGKAPGKKRDSLSIDDIKTHESLLWEGTSSSRIGTKYQVSFLPSPDTYKNESNNDNCLEPTQIWDPSKARAKNVDNFIQNCISPSIKEFALERLHARDYEVNGFMRDLEEIAPLDGSDWPIEEHDNFRKLMLETNHDVISSSKKMGKSIANCLTVYYKMINVRETRSSRRRRDSKRRQIVREVDANFERNLRSGIDRKRKREKHDKEIKRERKKKKRKEEPRLQYETEKASPVSMENEVKEPLDFPSSKRAEESNPPLKRQPKESKMRSFLKPNMSELMVTKSGPPITKAPESLSNNNRDEKKSKNVDIEPKGMKTRRSIYYYSEPIIQPNSSAGTSGIEISAPQVEQVESTAGIKASFEKKDKKRTSIISARRSPRNFVSSRAADSSASNKLIPLKSTTTMTKKKCKVLPTTSQSTAQSKKQESIPTNSSLTQQKKSKSSSIEPPPAAETGAADPSASNKSPPLESPTTTTTKKCRVLPTTSQSTAETKKQESLPTGSSLTQPGKSKSLPIEPTTAAETRKRKFSPTKTQSTTSAKESSSELISARLRRTSSRLSAASAVGNPGHSRRQSLRLRSSKSSSTIQVKKEVENRSQRSRITSTHATKPNNSSSKDMKASQDVKATSSKRHARIEVQPDVIVSNVVRVRKADPDENFEEKFQMLLAYKRKHGHCYVPKIYPENQPLAYWVFRVRGWHKDKQRGKQTRLTEERMQRLESVGFAFRVKNSKAQLEIEWMRRKPKDDAKWKHYFEELKSYKEEFGNCLVPKVYPKNQPLSTWVFAQRQQRRNFDNPDKTSRLTREKIKELDDIGFVWQAKRDKEWLRVNRIRKQALVEEHWQSQFSNLVAFKKNHGHTRVPKKYSKNQSLSSWVFRQRGWYKDMLAGENHKLTPSRLKQLQDIDFEFRVKSTHLITDAKAIKTEEVARTNIIVEENQNLNAQKLSNEHSCPSVTSSRASRAARRSIAVKIEPDDAKTNIIPENGCTQSTLLEST